MDEATFEQPESSPEFNELGIDWLTAEAFGIPVYVDSDVSGEPEKLVPDATSPVMPGQYVDVAVGGYLFEKIQVVGMYASMETNPALSFLRDTGLDTTIVTTYEVDMGELGRHEVTPDQISAIYPTERKGTV